MADLLVKKSKIHERGVFAARDFKKEEVVIDWSDAPILTLEEAAKLPESEKRYVFYDGEKCRLNHPPARFVNHSCNPNTRVINYRDVAIRDIKKGEEITGDYSSENNPNLKIKCNCGSKKCRGVIKTD